MSMPDEVRQQLAQRRRDKRAAAASDRFEKSRLSLSDSLRRDRARTDGRRVQYFRDRYGRRAADAMDARREGRPVPDEWRVS